MGTACRAWLILVAIGGSASAAPEDVTIAAVGDLMLGSTYPDASGGALPPDDGAKLLAPVTALLSGADVAFGNLEGPLWDGGGEPHCTPGGIAEKSRGRPGGTTCFAFRMPVRYAKLLRAAGFDVVSLANNHIDDFGPEGRASTEQALDAQGIRHSGATGTVAHLEVRGRKLDVIAFTTYPGLNDLHDLDAARALVAASAAHADLVMVSLHGGAEGPHAQRVPKAEELFYGERRGDLQPFAHAMIEAGADLVVGSGPHVVRGLELYKGRLIAYSLGTFASYRGINVSGVLGLTAVLEVRLGPDGAFVGGRLHAVRQVAPGGPRPDAGAAIVSIVRKLSRQDFAERAPEIARDGTLSP
jgi:hypothetical protein